MQQYIHSLLDQKVLVCYEHFQEYGKLEHIGDGYIILNKDPKPYLSSTYGSFTPEVAIKTSSIVSIAKYRDIEQTEK